MWRRDGWDGRRGGDSIATLETILYKSGKNSYDHGMKTILSEKGQITLPKKIRQELGFRSGDVLEVRKAKGGLFLKRKLNEDPLLKLVGSATGFKGTDAYLRRIRGPAFSKKLDPSRI